METQVVNYTLEDAYAKLEERCAKMDWKVDGDLPSEADIKPESRNQEKKIQRAINRAVKKGTRRSFNSMFYKISRNSEMPTPTVKIGDKEREIQRTRKVWKELQAKADAALQDYKNKKGDFYKKREL